MVGEVISIGASRGAAATKNRILDAAEALFMEHGFEATSLRAITRRRRSTSPPSTTTSAARKSCSRRCSRAGSTR